MIATVVIYVLEDQNWSLDQMAEVEISGFDSIVERVPSYLGCNVCINYGFYILNRRLKHDLPLV